jgi:hypothetical protein
MQTTIYSAHDEQELMARLWSPAIKNNPLAFVMYVFPWGEKGTPLEHFDGPRKLGDDMDAVHQDRVNDDHIGQQREPATLGDLGRDNQVAGDGDEQPLV